MLHCFISRESFTFFYSVAYYGPLGRTSQTQWLPHWALPTISVDPDGSIWRYYYDQRGNLHSVIDPTNSVPTASTTSMAR
uniref:hypothetical protein n=1 Tax=Snodgrassella alvi TaxID=1196083 RepID=UPI000C1DDB12